MTINRDILITLINSKDFTTKQLCEKADISRQTLWNIRTHQYNNVAGKTIEGIAKALNVSPTILMNFDD